MAQATDFTLSNQAFGTFRTELNSILSAVNSCQSGTTTPPSAVAGTIWLDTTSATTPTLKYYDGADNISLATIDHVGNTVNWLDSTVSITGLTTTATGTVLTLSDTNLNSTVSIRIPTSKGIDDDSGNEFLKFTKTASAVNEFTIINSATGNAPEIQATGGDTNIDLKITPKGSGKINLDGIKFPNADGSANQALVTDGSGSLSFATIATFNTPLAVVGNATAGSEIRLPEDTDNGSNYVALKAPNTIASNLTLTLPSADGTANQLLKTDGSGNLSFVTPSAGFSGATTTSSAVDITLTSASTQVQFASMTAADKAVILPDATTLTTKGFPLFVIANNGVYNFNVKNNGGYTLIVLAPTQSVELTLADNSTSNGVWASDSVVFNLGTMETNLTTVKSGTTGTSTALAHFNPASAGVSIDKLTSTTAIIFYVAGTSNRDVYGVVVSYSGTTITVNSETLLYSGSSTAATCFTSVVLDSTTGLIIVGRTSNKIAVPFTISGTTITAGTQSATFGAGTGAISGGFQKPVAVSSTLACTFDNTATDGLSFKLRTILHNGASAPTIGTASSTAITTSDANSAPTLSPISSTKVFIVYQDTTALTAIARIGTLDGTNAPTFETANTSATTVNGPYIGNIKQVSSTEFIYVNISGSDAYTVSGNTVTFVSSTLASNANSIYWGYYDINNVFFGNYSLRWIWTPYVYYQLLEKVGNVYFAKAPIASLVNNATTNSLTATANAVALDSTTIMVATNNNGVGTKVAAYLMKYIGA